MLQVMNCFSRTRGGDPDTVMYQFGGLSVFPAHAGVILDKPVSLQQDRCFSRTRGGDPKRALSDEINRKFFPHTRGIDYIK